jgi:hypothetical protein
MITSEVTQSTFASLPIHAVRSKDELSSNR